MTEEINFKKNVLEEACIVLKQEFIGLNGIIDEISTAMLSWWLFPQYQNRPLIINLWGMTGSGKTALIKRLFEILSYDKYLLRFDMGEFGNNSSFLKYIFTGQLNVFHQIPAVIVLDEFQFAKTKDETGKEVNNTSLRVIWDLLDSGELLYEPSVNTYYLYRVKKAIPVLAELKKRGATIKNGLITNLANEVNDIFTQMAIGYLDGNIDRVANPTPFKPEEILISDIFCTSLYELTSDTVTSWKEVAEKIKVATDFDDIIKYIKISIDNQMALKKMDLSKSLIFVIGNLDEAYSMSNNINPDIDADEFKRFTEKITVADIKTALQNRFRNEQIARLGNNHLIYHAFSNQNFMDLIDLHLNKIKDQLKSRFSLNSTFTDNVKKMLYAEGVFPTQGVRPIVSTLRNLMESNIAKIVLHIFSKKTKLTSLVWDFKDGSFIILFNDKSELKIPIVQKIDNLRKSTKNDLQAIVAVHETGHALVAMFLTHVLPEYVITRTVDSESNGFAYILLPEEIVTRRLLIDRIKIYLGGYAAEKLIFGKENNTTGVSHDLQQATNLVHQLIREYGMNDEPYKMNIHEYGGNSYQFKFNELHEKQGKDIMNDCLIKVETCLKEHTELFLTVSNYLSNNSRLQKEMLHDMYLKYAKKQELTPINFKTKETYYNFRSKLLALTKAD